MHEGFIGYENSVLYKLIWDEETQTIQSSGIHVPYEQGEYWSKHIPVWQKEITDSSGVFFVSD